MPHPSVNSSSVLVQQQPDQLQRGQDAHDFVDYRTQTGTETNDWFYGTEELLDALPQRWTRSMLYLLISFTIVVLPWAMFTKVDETGSARGRLEPQGATQKLGVAITSNVKAVNVEEGATVKAGQVLLELDSDVLQTQVEQAQTRLEELINRQGQQELLKNQLMLTINIQQQQNQAQELEKMAQVHQAQQNLDARQSTYNLQKLEKLSLVEQARQNINSAQLARNLANSRLQRDIKEVARYRQLLKQGAIAQIKVVELEKIAEESQRSLLQANADFTQAQLRLQEQGSRYQTTVSQTLADIEQAKLRLQEQQSSYQSLVQTGKLALLRSQEQLKDLQNQLTTLQSEIIQTKSQINAFKIQMQQRIVRSPVDGTIFDLPIDKPGPVVEAGQIVAQIAPKNAALVLRSSMPSQHSGFLKVGMPVKIKFDAYPFQDYGVLPGRVSWISPDSKIQTTSQGNIEVYEMDITLEHPYIQAGNKRISLTPGQSATAEVIIRQRRVIDFILDPFKKLQKGGLEL
ncbi:HlyD family efflux transporter periplasmic adaptor subunit [Anabaena subtropica]|uniref:HlyD family efflux transporter periplasmic adaptor subunit n=1 Tax=Anabaena subtropica FACHB-260 TaxID=2692884 RepID=A0ABR8CSN3_9NOST|nr:HlyD family efflux transporter periplasmic adaptor subunit [Anabaena subtropica]MBD2345893.1 HlyD family efflux transporter periplasmic adaptor subunit [Anabaena subtropica FACHB-260]